MSEEPLEYTDEQKSAIRKVAQQVVHRAKDIFSIDLSAWSFEVDVFIIGDDETDATAENFIILKLFFRSPTGKGYLEVSSISYDKDFNLAFTPDLSMHEGKDELDLDGD